MLAPSVPVNYFDDHAGVDPVTERSLAEFGALVAQRRKELGLTQSPLDGRTDGELWELINSGTLDPGSRAAVVTEYENRQVALLPQQLQRLSRHGLTAVSRYVAILLESAPSEGFRRADDK